MQSEKKQLKWLTSLHILHYYIGTTTYSTYEMKKCQIQDIGQEQQGSSRIESRAALELR